MGKKACQKKKTAQRNNESLPLSGSKHSDPESPQVEDEKANDALDKIAGQQELPSKRESALKEEIISWNVPSECI